MFHYDYFKNHDEFSDYKAGDTIFNEGDAGKRVMFAVKEGEVEIIHNGVVLETVTGGHFFGEMSLVDDAPRAATAVAKTDAKIIAIDKYHFLYLTHEAPNFALQVMHVMAERIRALHERVG